MISYGFKLFGGGGAGGSGVGTSLTTQVLYNNAGAVAGDAGLTYDAGTDTLTVAARVISPAFTVTNVGELTDNYSNGGVFLGGAATVNWASSYATRNVPDLGLARSSAGVLKVTDGSTGYGQLIALDQNALQGSSGRFSVGEGTAGITKLRGYSAVQLYASNGAVIQLGEDASATPVAQTLQAQGGSGTDIPGATLTIQSGAGTGAGAGSTLYFKTPSPHASDAVAQTQTTRMEINSTGVHIGTGTTSLWSVPSRLYPDGADFYLGGSVNLYEALYLSRATLGSKSKALTDASATAFATFTIADGATYTGEVIYNVKAVKGTALQALAGRVRFVATREGSTYTVAVAEVGTQTSAMAAGTLTGSISIAGTAGVVTLSATFDTSQSSPDSFAINYRFDSPDSALAITPL